MHGGTARLPKTSVLMGAVEDRRPFFHECSDAFDTFAAIVDEVRRERAERYLRDTRITLSHLARELGYAEQSVLTRSCHRWFGCGPASYRKALQST